MAIYSIKGSSKRKLVKGRESWTLIKRSMWLKREKCKRVQNKQWPCLHGQCQAGMGTGWKSCSKNFYRNKKQNMPQQNRDWTTNIKTMQNDSREKQITKSTFSLTMLNVNVLKIISLDDVRLRCLYFREKARLVKTWFLRLCMAR